MKRINWRYILGAVLFAVLAVGAVSLLGNARVAPPQETAQARIGQAAPPVAIKDAGAGEAAPPAAKEAPETLLARLRGGDPQAGRKIARKCAACHNFGPDGPRKVGPSLWNVVGAPKARLKGYPYSRALRQAGGVWTLAEIDSFLANPRQALPGTRMKFAGLRRARERADILLFLRGLADSPAPLPDPS
jgi:cytochrome c